MEQKKGTYKNLNDVPDTTWDKLSKKSFYFGHQSVGYNILDGVRDIMKDYPEIKLKIVESTDPAALTSGVLAHSRVGKNTQPETKINDFSRYIEGGIGKKADAAALKFCYVDILANADPEKLFAEYESEIEKIRNTFPNLTIIHFTAPLTTLQTGPKAWVKKIIGRSLGGAKENINRHTYNELLRAKYQGKEPILDIAKIESTNSDGTRYSFEVDGKTYYSLVPEYTSDGGHLNEIGRKKVAEQLILLLANL
ncbi:hypothetical protein DSCO28_18910 [Desulfosarcina ovata subsp. sediminis]|uniref:SGNH hydrolase-type esterase domain-containing protein n=1 Tax=Desulfosarcina ovata subsp. sediminis TaxID=885957 RepID=A0A5K7ZLX1_9BACT|nr:hypothetical protein [Desulfosarcina ovata]BBO81325.1 hypothetical protein DSCO28_18910 [Desulfosarcina ovata subsp. sediminis]